MKRKHSRNPVLLPPKIPKLETETQNKKKPKNRKSNKMYSKKREMLSSERCNRIEVDTLNQRKTFIGPSVLKENLEKSAKTIISDQIQHGCEKSKKGKVIQQIKKHFKFPKKSLEPEIVDNSRIALNKNSQTKCEKTSVDCQKQKADKHSRKVPGISKFKKTWRSKKFKLKTSDVKAKNKKTEPCPISIQKPSNPDEFSRNWKTFSQTLPTKEKKKIDSRKFVKKKGKEVKEEKKEIKTEMKNTIKTIEEKKPAEIWFDDVDDKLIETRETSQDKKVSALDVNKNSLVKPGSFKGLTNTIAMDCEMVGVGDGRESILARVSLVNHNGQCIYDTFVKPTEEVVDYRTHVSGVRPEDMEKGEEFSKVQYDVYKILKGRTLVGHALENDFKVLYFNHPRKNIRDTSKYKPFRQLFNGGKPSLKKLTAQVLNISVQEGEHNSIQDAQAAMRLYTMHKKQWEKDIYIRKYGKRNSVPKKDEKKSAVVS